MRRLRFWSVLHQVPELAEVLRERLGPDTLILSTCNRTEIYVGDAGADSPALVLAQIKDASWRRTSTF